MSEKKVTKPCTWTLTGYSYVDEKGECLCSTAPPPGGQQTPEELRALDRERDRLIAESENDYERLAELDAEEEDEKESLQKELS